MTARGAQSSRNQSTPAFCPVWSNAAAFSNAPRAAEPTPRRTASNSAASRSSNPHQQKEARKRLEAGETQRSVARSYNVSQSTISRLSG